MNQTESQIGAPKRVLFYSHTGEISGAEQMLLLTLRNLDRSRFHPLVLCPAEGGLLPACEALGVECFTTELVKARFTLRVDKAVAALFGLLLSAVKLRRRIAGLRPNLIHANSVRAGLVASTACFRSGIPVLWHIHDMLRPHPISSAIRLFALVSPSSHFVACSQAAATAFAGRLLLRFRPGSVTVAPNGIDTSKQLPASRTKWSVRRDLGLQPDVFFVGIVGQITVRKGHLGLLRAFAQFTKTYPNSELLVVGKAVFSHDAKYFAQVRSLAASLGITDKVRFLGSRPDIPEIMRALDLLVLNSTAEPFGLVILEAMLQGTPVLATRSGGPIEIIEHGRTGHLMEADDHELLARTLQDLRESPKALQTFGIQGPQLVKLRFSNEKYIAAIQATYSEVRRASSRNPTGVCASGLPADSMKVPGHV